MTNKDNKKKSIYHSNTIDNYDETEDSRNNATKTISKVAKKINNEKNNSGNIDEILQVDKELDKIKKNGSGNISKLNSHIKDLESSQENKKSLISVASISKDNNTPSKDISVERSLDSDLKKKLEKQEKKNVLIGNHSKTDFLKIFKNFETKDPNSSSLSAHLDNSKYFLNKQNDKKIIPVEKTSLGEKDSKKLRNNFTLSENKNKGKNNNIESQKNKSRNKQPTAKVVNSSIDNINKTMSTLYKEKCLFGFDCSCDFEITNRRKWRRRLRNCNIITLARDIFITLVVISAVGLYITIFFFT